MFRAGQDGYGASDLVRRGPDPRAGSWFTTHIETHIERPLPLAYCPTSETDGRVPSTRPERWPPASCDADWREKAASRDLPTEYFFPIGHGARAQAQAGLAKAVCKKCAVQADCLLYALAANTEYGVYGGLAEDERRALRRRLGLPVGPGPFETSLLDLEPFEIEPCEIEQVLQQSA